MVDVTSDGTAPEAEAPETEASGDDGPKAGPSTTEAAQQLVAAIEALRPEMAEPEDDELDEEIVFVRNGWIRVTISGKLHKLRRPFLGELRDLDLSREADQEILNDKNKQLREKTDVLMIRAREIEVEANEEGIDPQTSANLDIEATQLGLQANMASRALIREAHDIRAAWWQEVFKVLTPPGYDPPEQMPAWIGDINLQQRAIEHWQMVPLARGGHRGR